MPRLLSALALVVGVALFAVPSPAQDPKTLTIAEIMAEAHKPTGLFFDLQRGLKGAPDWAESADSAKRLTVLAEALAGQKPGKGDDASWKALTAQHLTQTKALQAAVLKKDKAAALAAAGKLSPALCNTCHKAHR